MSDYSLKILEIQTQSILTPSKLPAADYVLNPYTGCQFACQYCYASFMGRFVNETVDNWGNYLYVKTNAVSLLQEELQTWPIHRRHSSILLSSVTDPYQGAEKKYQLTRGLLQILAKEKYPGSIGILTKSPLVLRDIDILQNIPDAEVGMTITSTDDQISRFLEVRAPLASRRLDTLRRLHDAGIRTYAFIGPLLPHFRYQPELLCTLFKNLSETGVQSVYVEHINMKSYIRNRLWHLIEKESKEVQQLYTEADTEEHQKALESIVQQLVLQYHFTLRGNEVLNHSRS